VCSMLPSQKILRCLETPHLLVFVPGLDGK
jgi:hypothetical protein